MGADVVFKADDPEVVQKIINFSDITHTFECSGADAALVLAIRATSQGGKLVSIGRSAKPLQNVPLFEAADKEIQIIGSFRYCGAYKQALELVASGQVKVAPLVTHRYTVSQCQEAFERAESGSDGAIKVAIVVHKEK